MYLGIDQSLRSTGVAVLTEALELVELRTIVPGSRSGAPRLAFIRDALRGIASRYPVKRACLEGYAYDVTVGMVFQLGEVGGLVRLLLHDLSIPFDVAAPAQLKKFAGVSPQADKEKVQKGIEAKWSVKIDQNDAADAYVLARIARALELKVSTVRSELEVVKAILTPPEVITKTARSRVKHTA